MKLCYYTHCIFLFFSLSVQRSASTNLYCTCIVTHTVLRALDSTYYLIEADLSLFSLDYRIVIICSSEEEGKAHFPVIVYSSAVSSTAQHQLSDYLLRHFRRWPEANGAEVLAPSLSSKPVMRADDASVAGIAFWPDS